MHPPGVTIDPQPLPNRLSNHKDLYGDTYQQNHRDPRKLRYGSVQLNPYEVPAVSSSAVLRQNVAGQVVATNVRSNPQGKHKRLPPDRGTSEQKFEGKAGSIHSFLARYGMEPTEWIDFFEAIYSALPQEIRSDPRYHGEFMNRVRAVMENLDKIDTKEAIENLAKNYVEDRLFGELNRRLRDFGVEQQGFERYYRELTKRNRASDILEGY
jgi:hypothetical protein